MSSLSGPALLPPLSSKALQILQRDADAISQEVTEGYFSLHPECNQGNADLIHKMCKIDCQHHLSFLFSALSTATIDIFSDYVHWLKKVMLDRKLSLQHSIDAFTLLKHTISNRLDNKDLSLAIRMLDEGLKILTSNAPMRSQVDLDAKHVSIYAADYTQALIDGNKKQAETIALQSLTQSLNLIDMEVGIIQPAMIEIGLLWQQNKLTVAQEHLATAISQNVLARAFAKAEFSDPIEKKIICACVEGNHHGLGLRMISDAYEVSGWDVSFLGTDTPNRSIISQVDKEKPDALALSVSMPHQILGLKELLIQLRADMGGHLPIIILGGRAINNYQQLAFQLKADNCYLDAKSVWNDLN